MVRPQARRRSDRRRRIRLRPTSHLRGACRSSRASFHDKSMIAIWLQDAGYRTGLIGKYLNESREAALAGYEPPGWDRWVSFAIGNAKSD